MHSRCPSIRLVNHLRCELLHLISRVGLLLGNISQRKGFVRSAITRVSASGPSGQVHQVSDGTGTRHDTSRSPYSGRLRTRGSFPCSPPGPLPTLTMISPYFFVIFPGMTYEVLHHSVNRNCKWSKQRPAPFMSGRDRQMSRYRLRASRYSRWQENFPSPF